MTGPRILVLNSGSSSLKYAVVEPDTATVVADGIVERIGDGDVRDHAAALRVVFDELADDMAGVVAVGHRVVHGGPDIYRPTLVDDALIAKIDELSSLAPLHNPPALLGITESREALPDLPHVAVFDTAFFHKLPPAAATYAIDREVAERWRIRRYGFHGTSHQYVSEQAAVYLNVPLESLRQIVLHLGNGASAAAVVGGRAVDTSMGLTPLEGLVMGTRTGDIDPAVVFHLVRTAGMTVDDIDDLFNKRSGMRGLTGHNDMREVHRLIAGGDPDARLALDVYVHRLKKYVGAYAAVMGGLDVLTFTAGVGENDPVVRARTAAGLQFLGVEVDPARNDERSDEPRVISPDGATVSVLVVPTNEELAIARQTMSVV